MNSNPPKAAICADTPRPPISVIVCTRDRPRLLRRCLEALSRLTYTAYQVVVVDNASRDDSTAEVVSATPFRYAREDRPGLNWARNRGAAEARYDIIAYIDDDARADPGWLDGIADAFADSRVSAMTGLVLPLEMESEAQRLFEVYSGMSKGAQPRLFQRAWMRPREVIAAHAMGVGTNMAFRRSALELVGGFDTALDVGTPACGGGDLDLFHRLVGAGLTLRYEPRALVRHEHRRGLDELQRQIYCNGRSYGVYLIKVWSMHSVPRREVAGFAARWVMGGLVARLIRSATGQLSFPVALTWAEVWGALHAPWAYVATYRHDRQMRRSLKAT
jgi:glycosyltransferase involved in cell wall biosynthesis